MTTLDALRLKRNRHRTPAEQAQSRRLADQRWRHTWWGFDWDAEAL